MMKSVMAGLLAAVAVVPTAAEAQDVSLREALRQRMEARGGPERAQVRQQNERPRPEARADDGGRRGDRPERPRGGFEAEAPTRNQSQAGGWGRGDRPDRPGRPQGGWQRPDRPDRPEAPAGGWQQRADRPDRAGRRNDRPEPSSPPVQNAGRDPRDGRPLWTERNFRGRPDRDRRVERDRDWNRDWNRNRDNWGRNDWGRNDRNGRNWGWNGRDRDDRARWDRDWRRDPRYDWNRYRIANRSAYRLPRYYAPYGWNQGYRRFSIGVSLSSLLFAQDYWIADPYSYRLPDAYGPYRWVRYYDDALLVDVYSGEVVDAMYDFFW